MTRDTQGRASEQSLPPTGGSSSRHIRGLGVVLGLFIVLSSIYTTITPLFESSGEPFALRYALVLAHTGRIPDVVAQTDWWLQNDAHQPPLYYALCSLFVHNIPKDALDNLLQPNPYFTRDANSTAGNKNVIVHPLNSPNLPQVRAFIYLLRIISLIISLGTLLLTYCIARILVPYNRNLHLAAVAMAAFNPLFIVTSASVNSNSLLFLWMTTALFISLRIISQQKYDWRWWMMLGISAGLAAITSTVGLVTFALLPLSTFLLNRGDISGSRGKRLLLVSLSFILALAVAGWWYGRNWVVYKQPLLLSFYQTIANQVPTSPVYSLIRQIPMYWGVFGWGNIQADQAYYAFAGILGTLGILGLLVQLARIFWEQRKLQLTSGPIWLLATVWCLVTGVWVLFVRKLDQPQIVGFLAISVILAVVTPIGLKAWLPAYLGDIFMWTMPGLLLVMAVISPFRYIIPAYQASPLLTLEQVPQAIRDVNLNYEDQLFLLGYDLSNDHVKAGDSVTLELYWVCKRKMDLNYTISIRVYGRDQTQIGEIDTYPDSGKRATRFLTPGSVMKEKYILQLDGEAVTPTAAEIRVAVYSVTLQRYLNVVGTLGQNLENAPVVTRLAVLSPQPEHQVPQVKTDVNLGNKVQLVGYSLSSSELVPNSQWVITLYWRSITPMSEDYTVFVHLLNEDGVKFAQVDEQPINNYFPTSLWQTQETIRDPHTLILPADISPGNYTLSIGLYLLSTGQRLPIVPSSLPETDIKLGTYSLVPK